LERSLKIYEKALGPEHPRVAMSLNNLAVLLETQGNYAEARPLQERALKIREKALGPEHPDVAMSLNNLAMLLQTQGNYQEARPLFERALRIVEKALGPEHPDVALSLNNLALLLQTQGNYGEARPLYERSLKIREKALDPEHPDVANSLNSLAGLLETQGNYEEARPLFERSLKIYEKALGPEHPKVALSLNNLASLLKTQGNYDEARPLYERSIKIWEKALGPEHPDVATSMNNLASLLCEQGDYGGARPLYERSLKIYEKALGPEHPDVARSLNNLATLLCDQGNHEEAHPLFERSLKIREKALGPEHSKVATSLNNLAALLSRQGEHERAQPLSARCLRISEAHLRQNLSGLQGSSRLAFALTQRRYLTTWLEVAAHVKRSGFPEVLRFKGLLARAALAERRASRAANPAILKRLEALRAAERRLAKVANAPPPFFNKQKKAAWQEAYAKAAAEREELALALQRDHAPLRQGLERLDISLLDIQRQLGRDAVLLDFLRAGEAYVAWLVRPAEEPKRIELGPAEKIEVATAAFVQATAHARDAAWQRAGERLCDLVLAPIRKHFGSEVKTIHVCPDAALAAVPFAALPGRDGGLLIDDYLITTLAQSQDLVPWPDEPGAGEGALLIGGVNYGEATVGAQEATVEKASVDRAPRGRNFAYLPGTKAEAEAIQAGFGEGASLLLDGQATENRLRAGSRGRRVLHLATHGFVRDDLMRGLHRGAQDDGWLGAGLERQLARGHDPLLLAGLAMAGANPREGGHGDDGVLTALEASHLYLDGVELVALSACQTALGRAESGEGVVGLVQGFQMAGAKQVIGSLWKVDDEATRALMVAFYALWDEGRGIPAPEALRKAQDSLRGQEKWKHPYYWAAWVLWSRR
jgi:CHAT domain-containing protein/Tfp pilus assembly protein PilF